MMNNSSEKPKKSIRNKGKNVERHSCNAVIRKERHARKHCRHGRKYCHDTSKDCAYVQVGEREDIWKEKSVDEAQVMWKELMGNTDISDAGDYGTDSDEGSVGSSYSNYSDYSDSWWPTNEFDDEEFEGCCPASSNQRSQAILENGGSGWVGRGLQS
jgi:hypothetical protein